MHRARVVTDRVAVETVHIEGNNDARTFLELREWARHWFCRGWYT